jgi:hypothetical protein
MQAGKLKSYDMIADSDKRHLFSKASRMALGSTYPPIQMGPEYLFLGVMWSEHAAGQWPPFSVKVKNE